MIKPLITKVRPLRGFARAFHLLLLSLLPIIVFVLVRIEFAVLAAVLIVLSKWRMFAVKPRFWPANFRANSVDILVGLSTLIFMTQTSSQFWQVIWAVLFFVWLTFIKPASQTLMIAVQALISFVYGLGALFLIGDDMPAVYLVLGVGLICYLAAHHFFDAFEEVYARLLSYIWGFFGAAITWVLSHWLLYYPQNEPIVAQPMLLLVIVGYGLAALYYLDHTDRLSALIRNQFIFIMCAISIVILLLSDWGDKII